MEPFIAQSLIILRALPYLLILIVAIRSNQTRLSIAAILGAILALLAFVNAQDGYFRDILRGVFALVLLWHTVDIASFINKKGGKPKL